MTGKAFCRAVVLVLVPIALTGCADKVIKLSYVPDTSLTRLAGAQPVAVYRFTDRRDDEGDNDPFRVGGVYGGYGNRLSKVLADAPFQKTLAEALVTALRARGIDAQVVEDRTYQPGTVVPTSQPGTAVPASLVLAGDIKHFSTEARFTNSAHVRGIVRVYSSTGQLLVEKDISEREKPGSVGVGVMTSDDLLADAMNKALAKFVNRIASDPEIVTHLTRP